MEHVKRFIFVVSLFVLSMIVIHTTRAPQRISMEVQTVCFPAPLAKKLGTDAALKWDAQIAYDTVENDQKIPSYRCYVSFPKVDVVCTPKNVADRNNLQNCPTFPSLLGHHKTCYFLNKKHHSFAQKFSQKQSRMSMKDLNGVVVKTIPEAKKILMKKK